MEKLTPKQIVKELDRYIIGQQNAKKAVAVALRNRYRRSQLPPEVSEEITPKNIIMQGPTGVGKTEIARRLAKLVKAPFVKVEATKYTEVGYVGRDVESMVRDLVEVSVRLVRDEMTKDVEIKAKANVYAVLLKAVFPLRKSAHPDKSDDELKEIVRKELESGELNDLQIEIELPEASKPQQLMPGGVEINIGDIMGGLLPKRKKLKKVTVARANAARMADEADRLIDQDNVNSEAIRRAENEGIIFIDEMDKIAGKGNANGPDVSREGVQRDILPIVEGCTVNTKYGQVKTDYILFIAAGAFHIASVSDLIPELQGRFPIIVRLDSLTEDDFVEILTKTDNAILRQYKELLKVDKVLLDFSDEAIREIASVAAAENENSENIGARRLHTIMESLLDDISYNAGNLDSEVTVTIDKKYVLEHLDKTIKTLNLRKYVL